MKNNSNGIGDLELDEAIKHADAVANSVDGSCAMEHRQLSSWLRELKKLREYRKIILKENAIMREALEKLSRLGAGDRLGNSDGNCIAQRALKEAKGDK